LYAFRRAALARFVALSPSPLEQREKLEQLRALEAGMRIDASIVASVPLGVDTLAHPEPAREILRRGQGWTGAKKRSVPRNSPSPGGVTRGSIILRKKLCEEEDGLPGQARQ